MPKINTIALAAVVTLLTTNLGFTQSDSIKNAIVPVRQIVIGNKPDKEIRVSNPDTVQKQAKAVFPGSVTVVDKRDSAVFQIIPADDDIIAARVEGLENIMPMPYNEHVKKYIDYFLYKRPSFVKEMLEKKEFYFPVFERYLAQHGIPDEMKYLALLESGLEPTIMSHAKAVGLWQFMSPTAREYGLKINDYMDERMHIEKSTDASFRYLTWLHNYFHDWELALASYNTGPGNLRRAIRRSGKTDYWDLHNYIHRDTRAYVPQWAALNYLMNYSAEHGIFPDPEKTMYPLATENLLLDGPLNLEKFAELNYLDLNTIKRLNPHFTSNDIPSYARNLEIKIPQNTYAYFEENKDCIIDLASVLSDPSDDIASITDSKGTYHIEKKTVKKYYRVRSGDYLGKIASRNGVRVSDLKRWNKLRSNTIQKGQRLVFYKTESTRVYDAIEPVKTVTKQDNKPVLAKNTTTPPEERTNVKVVSQSNKIASTSEKKVEPSYTNVSKTVKRYHFVKRGDNLTHIARAYGTSISQLKDWNNLRSNNIQKGQRLAYYTTITERVYDNVKVADDGTILVHTVQAGDTLWAISKKYGYSIEQIKKLNGMSNNTVKVGQKIKVKA
ncbi:LysM peptidoglycan-binding domain-containing protein [uncultured Arcticibacterium sp.]|uniref:LysM peptidoglycan-binding domain-containing protein n=1 Tax=uncultured Arcticibacterium sp. TaxID=2173042 RepID=UPI0030F62C76